MARDQRAAKWRGESASARSDNEKERGAVGRHRAAGGACFTAHLAQSAQRPSYLQRQPLKSITVLWRNGSASDSSPEGCGFDSLGQAAPVILLSGAIRWTSISMAFVRAPKPKL